jgi:hypothetical protein
MELEIYEAFKSAGVADEKAKAAAESVGKAMDRRFDFQERQLATKADVAGIKTDLAAIKTDLAEMESRVLKTIAETQRWTMGAIFAGMAAVATIIKLL